MTDPKPTRLQLGIWFEFGPAAAHMGEGISRASAWLIGALAADPQRRIVIATAKWSQADLLALLREHGVPLENIEILCSRDRIPVAARLERLLSGRRLTLPQPPVRRVLRGAMRVPRSLFGGIRDFATNILVQLLTTSSFFTVGLALLLILILGIVGAPFLLLAVVLRWFYRTVLARPWVKAKLRKVYHAFRFGLPNLLRKDWRLAIKRSRWSGFFRRVRTAMHDREFLLLARRAARRQDVHIWYSPHPFASHLDRIGKPFVVAIPDVVYADIPNSFDPQWIAAIDQRMQKVTNQAAATISYCNYVRVEHAVGKLGVQPARARVIPHGAVDVSTHMATQVRRCHDQPRLAAIQLIHDFMQNRYRSQSWTHVMPLGYLGDFPFDEVDYIFVSSQIRPHKNYLGLFSAFEMLLRQRYCNLKLIISGDLESETLGLCEFIRQRHLELDIISIPATPSDVHAAFYHLAKLTVVPTLFEGGFPFPCTESLSVGTPVVMSDIAMTREVIPSDLAPLMLFDPYDVPAMADRIQWALQHRAELLGRQQQFYQQLKQRTWAKVADEYINVFREVSEGSEVSVHA